jgi:hypothetical protein
MSGDLPPSSLEARSWYSLANSHSTRATSLLDVTRACAAHTLASSVRSVRVCMAYAMRTYCAPRPALIRVFVSCRFREARGS